MADVPAWADAGLHEAARLVELLRAEKMSGEKEWSTGKARWRLRVTQDWVDATALGADEPLVLAAESAVELNVVYGWPSVDESWSFAYRDHAWVALARTRYG